MSRHAARLLLAVLTLLPPLHAHAQQRPSSLPWLSVPPARERPAEPPVTNAAEARDAFDREAAKAISTATGAAQRKAARPWHWTKWINEGDGAVGRLHDLCTGAVEPKPTLTIGAWTWESVDPRRLGPADRQTLLEWRGQQFASLYGCGTMFYIGDLAARAKKAAGFEPAPSGSSPKTEASQAFVDYVRRHPDLRRSNDLAAVAGAALRDAAARQVPAQPATGSPPS